MKLVTCMGEVWTLTDKRYRQLVEHIAAGGQDIELPKYGASLGTVKMDVTDIDDSLRDECRSEVRGYHHN